jgi:hypothetical protein
VLLALFKVVLEPGESSGFGLQIPHDGLDALIRLIYELGAQSSVGMVRLDALLSAVKGLFLFFLIFVADLS